MFSKFTSSSTLLIVASLYSLGANAFTSTLKVTSPFISHSHVSPLSMAKSRSSPDLEVIDDDGKAILIPVKNIERDWTWAAEDYKAEGEFSVNLFLPEDSEGNRKDIKGCAFFMHGFSQYPIAYRETLMKASQNTGVAIIAVETGVTSGIVFSDLMNKPDGAGRDYQQFALQRAVSQDTKQCIKMVLEEQDDVFEEYGITAKSVKGKIAVMGHSMGGGLSFPVAADEDIDYVFTMAPAFGVDAFDPIEAVSKHTPDNAMLLAGSWDLIASDKKVKSIAVASNKEKESSSLFVDIKKGLHTGFQDKVVLFGIPLFRGIGVFGLLWNILGFAETIIFSIARAFLAILSFNKKRIGQLAGTQVLMEYFLNSMVEGKDITLQAAEKFLDDNLDDRDEKNFDFSYPTDN